jgi:N-acetylmuramoyl-L-alanine amidase
MRSVARRHSATIQPAFLAIAASLLLVCAGASRADGQQKKALAHAQYERAEQMRTALEGRPQNERTVEEYKRVVEAYRRVYHITPQAPEVTPALMAVAELYQKMGRQFDPQYFQASIEAYQFLLKEYPGTKHRSDALFTIGQIQQEDLNQLDAAEVTFHDFLERYPQSDKAEDAQAALQKISETREKQSHPGSSAKIAAETAKERLLPRVTSIRSWNAENYTRIVVEMEDAVKYQAARIKNPDRIYFDLDRAKLSPALAGKTFELQNGFLKGIRVAQNQKGVVRIVLDVDSVNDYSAFLLPNPYRLVIDVHGKAEPVAARHTVAHSPPATEVAETESVTSKPAGKAAEPESADAGKSAAAPEGTTAPHRSTRSRHEPAAPPATPKPTRDGQLPLTRALGLKISRIVIDAGHGGHDTGTIGPHGLMEKDLCLDVALRLGKLIGERLPGAEVIYTRKDDTFVPLENRTALANQEKADLFISIHANSSHDQSARGVETYYLNFATSEDSMEVAARENALSQSSIHELQDLIKKIARNEKIEESKELASDIQEALSGRMQKTSRAEKDRGVKKAPFVVLIGANMPSVLSEISFLSNPSDERMLKRAEQRQRVAEGLFHGVESYLASLNSLSYNRQKPISTRQ